MQLLYILYLKELKDILRDRRALITTLLVSSLSGPLLLLLISSMLANFETRSERRIIMIDGAQYAPSLVNHLLRETATIENAPEGYEQDLLTGKLADPVLKIPKDFEALWQTGQPIKLHLITSTSNSKANAGVGRVKRWVSGLNADRSSMIFVERSLSSSFNDFIQIEDIDLSNPRTESSKLFGILPYFFVLAALYGVWGSAIESTAGERDQKTLEPLMLACRDPNQIVMGKWLAITSIGAIVSLIAILAFLPAQWLMGSETLKVMFSFGVREVIQACLLILPLTGFLAACLMWVGAYARSTRQAQTYASLLLFFTAMIPMLMTVDGEQASPLMQSFPIIAQHHGVLQMMQGTVLPFETFVFLFLTHLLLTLAILIQVRKKLIRV